MLAVVFIGTCGHGLSCSGVHVFLNAVDMPLETLCRFRYQPHLETVQNVKLYIRIFTYLLL